MSIMYPYPAAFNVQDPWCNPGTGYIGMVPGGACGFEVPTGVRF
jgi:hypothetical protein